MLLRDTGIASADMLVDVDESMSLSSRVRGWVESLTRLPHRPLVRRLKFGTRFQRIVELG
jgi:hypothetical protein